MCEMVNKKVGDRGWVELDKPVVKYKILVKGPEPELELHGPYYDPPHISREGTPWCSASWDKGYIANAPPRSSFGETFSGIHVFDTKQGAMARVSSWSGASHKRQYVVIHKVICWGSALCFKSDFGWTGMAVEFATIADRHQKEV